MTSPWAPTVPPERADAARPARRGSEHASVPLGSCRTARRTVRHAVTARTVAGSVDAHERRVGAVEDVEPTVSMALGQRVAAVSRPVWPIMRRAARRTARHAARGGPERSLAASTRTSGRRGQSAASSRSCRWRSAGASAALGRSRRSRAAARAGRGGASPAHESGKTRIEPTRWPRVPGRRGWARDPRRARRSGLERPVGRDPHFGHSLTGA